MINTVLPRLCDPKVDVIGLCANWIQIVYGQDGGLMTKVSKNYKLFLQFDKNTNLFVHSNKSLKYLQLHQHQEVV